MVNARGSCSDPSGSLHIYPNQSTPVVPGVVVAAVVPPALVGVPGRGGAGVVGPVPAAEAAGGRLVVARAAAAALHVAPAGAVVRAGEGTEQGGR